MGEYLCCNACGSGTSCVLQAVPHLRDLSSQRFEREPTGLSTLGTFEAVSINVPNMMFGAGFEGRVENWRGRGDGGRVAQDCAAGVRVSTVQCRHTLPCEIYISRVGHPFPSLQVATAHTC